MKRVGDDKVIVEKCFNEKYLGKYETIMALGNGYMGLRSATEESYITEKRNLFIAGTFNQANEKEVTELPNLPDVLKVEIWMNGKRFDLTKGTVQSYERKLNLETGELTRNVVWETEETGVIHLSFKRIVSMHNKHLIVQHIDIIPETKDVEITIESGVNGQVTNSGSQHFIEGSKRFYDNKIMYMDQVTSQSKIDVIINTAHTSYLDEKEMDDNLLIRMDRRKIFGEMNFTVKKDQRYSLQKTTIVGTSRDKEFEGLSKDALKNTILDITKKAIGCTYKEHRAQSEKAWKDLLWDQVNIQIESKEENDLLALRFAQYHLQIMTPVHDNRMGIAAKGLTGEGYKGHSFWDTEIFMFPYFLYTQPKIARQLLEYRYQILPGARKKAKDNGYEGAMFPWESAWLDDGEVTPVWGAADVVTGKQTKIWSGFIEQHITADISFAVWQYYMFTGDEDFMEQYGYEILFDTATFWASRVEYSHEDGKYHINNVIGPDEYKEHIDDNAFTNYMAKLNLDLAIKYASKLQDTNLELFKKIDEKINFSSQISKWQDRGSKLTLPKPNKDLIIPQDSTYLEKEIIDLTQYKNQEHVGSMFDDYSLEQVNQMQVTKQADIMMLFYLCENLFSKEVKIANWNYYEPKTLHDSSLSLSTHSIIACDIGDYKLAYDLFTRCRQIDLGPNMKSSDHGIHAASLGGLIQGVINGFGGLRMLDGMLRIEPHLPSNWESMEYEFHWRGDIIKVHVKKDLFIVENKTQNNELVEFKAFGNQYLLREKVSVLN